MPLAQRYVPIRGLDITRINRVGQNVGHLLVTDISVIGARKFREGFQEAFDFGLYLKTPRCEALQGFLDDGGAGLIANQNLSIARASCVAVANGSLKDPIAVNQARAHPVFGLFAILLPLVLRNTGQQVFNEDRI
ncbi:TPA: hypothetical protein L5Q58_006234 [Pseudomonas aeruginosa]|nr:hypothetical protein [Pseudomonas aeruginosa]AZZ10870.1 hypothetical protein CEK59_04125 [Pseudomonas aeruginosa]KSJ39169.1 hypothetical protein APA00_16125 [Pseudomonas aeruginosa]MCT5063149.1 hypothetical protein [Pseudomonas aeruginosa]MCZ9745884.1 hypothetical protein [Pseudomonas aeruginosa]MDN4679140.1 hypothetical protein [Pseudomonas aeruginosa]